MGFAEKLNPRSTYYKKRYNVAPAVQEIAKKIIDKANIEIVEAPKKLSFMDRLKYIWKRIINSEGVRQWKT